MRRPVVIAVVAVLVVVAVVAALVLTGAPRPAPPAAGPDAGPRPAAPAPAPIDWGPCEDELLNAAGVECGTVEAPLDWSHPGDGRTVQLAVSRARHAAQPFEGIALAGPGGPGGSGLRLATLGAQVPRNVGARYDWIGFDPRGVGASRPRLTCDADYANGPRPQYTPATDEVIRAWRDRSEAYAEACAENGDLLEHMTTRDAAQDLDHIRRALGVDRISYLGRSYATYLGQVYATLFPKRVRRMVLDSTVDPTRVWYDANLDQGAAFQIALEAWFDWLAEHADVYDLGSSRAEVEATYRAAAERLAAEPSGGVLGSAELADTLLSAGYSQSRWPGLADALAAAERGDASALQAYWTQVNQVTEDNGYAVYLAVECTDAPWPEDWATWERDTRRVDADAPFGTWLNTWFNAPCRTWPAPAQEPVEVDGSAAPPILIVGETLDAATPFSGSLAVRRLFPRASLLAEPGGTSHAKSLLGNACVDGAIADYLDDGTLPDRVDGDRPDTTCDPLPVPTP